MIVYIINLLLISLFGYLFYTFSYRLPLLPLGNICLTNSINIKWINFTEKYSSRTETVKKILYIICCLQLFILSALRTNIGIDFVSYRDKFNTISQLPINRLMQFYFEKGFLFLNATVALFTDNFQWVIVLSSAITIGCVAYSIYKQSTSPFLSVFLYITLMYYYGSFCLIRQGIAISISLTAFTYLKKQNFLKYLLLVLLASLFHSSALILIPIYFIANINLTLKKVVTFFGISILLYLFLNKIIQCAVRFNPSYRNYLSSEYMSGMSFKSLIIPLTACIILFIFKKRMISLQKSNNIYANMAFFSLLLSLLQTKMQLFDRFPYYLNIYIIFSLPILIRCFDVRLVEHFIRKFPQKTQAKVKKFIYGKDAILRKAFFVCVVSYGVIYNIYGFAKGFYGVVPYQAIPISELGEGFHWIQSNIFN